MSAFWHAVAFLTRFPIPKKALTADGWTRSPRYYPIVGLMIGLVLWLTGWLAEWGFGPGGSTVAAVVTVGIWIYVTGGLHLDGWMDLADGLGSHRSRERMLEIMKDSRVGAMGVIAAIVLMGCKVAALQLLAVRHDWRTIVLIPAMARFALVGAIAYFPYIQPQGLGSGLRQGINRTSLLLQWVFLLALSYFILGFAGWIVFGLMVIAAWLFGRDMVRRLGGFTGDVYGALVEAMETFVLLVYLILIQHLSL